MEVTTALGALIQFIIVLALGAFIVTRGKDMYSDWMSRFDLSKGLDMPYTGPRGNSRVWLDKAHVVEKGQYRLLIDINGHRVWLPFLAIHNVTTAGIHVDFEVLNYIIENDL